MISNLFCIMAISFEKMKNAMTWRHTITHKLGIAYPIVQAPMLSVSTPQMAAAVSNAGGLGSLPVGGLSADATRQLIRETKALTGQPFAVNLFAHDLPAYTENDIAPMRELIVQLAQKRGYTLDTAGLSNFTLHSYQDQVAVLVEENIPIVSFTFGCLDDTSIQLLKACGCMLIGTATCVEEALYLQKHNVDIAVVQGIEAGGHRGSFLTHIPLPQVGLFSLLPQVAGTVSIPCIAAGGIHNAASMQAAFELGAAAVQIGTAFIGTAESNAPAAYRQRLEQAKDTDTALTRAFSGRWARGIRNELMNSIEQSHIPIPPFPLQSLLLMQLRILAQQQNDTEYMSLWSGQCAGKPRAGTATGLIQKLVSEYEKLHT